MHESADKETNSTSTFDVELMLAIHQRLTLAYSAPVIHQSDRLGPVSQLVNSLIADGASPERADRAFRSLCAAFWSWPDVRDAPRVTVHRLLADIDPTGRTASLIVAVLKSISEATSWQNPTLEFLSEIGEESAVDWLCRLGRVPAHVAAEVLLLSSLRRRILPVGPSRRRLAERTGQVKPSSGEREAQSELNQSLPPQWRSTDIEVHYFVSGAHAREYCIPRRPRCGPCPIRDLCNHGSASQPGHRSVVED